MNGTELLPPGWKHLVARLKDKCQTALLAIAAEEVFLDRQEFDERLSQPAKSWDRESRSI